MLAEDDDFLEGTTAPPRPFFTAVSRRQQKPTQPTIPDFDLKPQEHLETTLRMTKPSLIRRGPVAQTPVSDTAQLTTQPPINATAETTTAPITTAATTEAPDPDAEVCSGRPFDAFMQLKNGSIYALRGE